MCGMSGESVIVRAGMHACMRARARGDCMCVCVGGGIFMAECSCLPVECISC